MALAPDAGMSQGAYFLFDRKKKWNRILEKRMQTCRVFWRIVRSAQETAMQTGWQGRQGTADRRRS